jgi:hypothetical protein
MTTTTSAAGVMTVRATPDEIGAQLREDMLAVRDRYVSRAPKDDALHQLRRSMNIGRVKAMEMIARVMIGDVDDGVPVAASCGWMFDLMAILEQRAQERAQARGEAIVGPSPLALIERQNRVQDRADMVEMRIAANPTDLVALDERIALSAENEAAEDLLVADLRARRVRLTTTGYLMVMA